CGRLGFRPADFGFHSPEKLFRIGTESFETSRVAKVIGLTFVIVFAGGGFRHHLHVAYRIGLKHENIIGPNPAGVLLICNYSALERCTTSQEMPRIIRIKLPS